MKDKIITSIKDTFEIISAIVLGTMTVLDQGMIIRRVVLAWATYMQGHSLWWAYSYATNTAIPGTPTEKAALIAAVLGVVSTLFGAVIKFYNESRKDS